MSYPFLERKSITNIRTLCTSDHWNFVPIAFRSGKRGLAQLRFAASVWIDRLVSVGIPNGAQARFRRYWADHWAGPLACYHASDTKQEEGSGHLQSVKDGRYLGRRLCVPFYHILTVCLLFLINVYV